MIKQLFNSVIAKYRDLSVSRRSIVCLSLRELRQIIDLLATDKSRYFAQPRPLIVNYYSYSWRSYHELDPFEWAKRPTGPRPPFSSMGLKGLKVDEMQKWSLR